MLGVKALLVTPYFWPERLGIAPYATEIAEGLAARGVDLVVLTGEPHYPSKHAIDGTTGWATAHLPYAVRRTPLRDRSSGRLGVRLWNDLAFARSVIGNVRGGCWRKAPALVISPTILAVPALRLAGHHGPIVLAVYDVESELAVATGIFAPQLQGLLRSFERACVRRADTLVTISTQMAETLQRLHPDRDVTVIPLWSACGVFEPRQRPASRPPTFMYSGGLSPRHGVQLLPRIWSELRRRMPEAQFIVQGDGSERESVHAALREIGGNLSLRLPVEKETLAQSLQDADLQIVLQLSGVATHTLPSKALTCIGAGVPIVTNAEAHSTLGLLIDHHGLGIRGDDDVAAITGQIADLFAAPKELEAMQTRVGAYAAQHLDRERSIDAYLAALRP